MPFSQCCLVSQWQVGSISSPLETGGPLWLFQPIQYGSGDAVWLLRLLQRLPKFSASLEYLDLKAFVLTTWRKLHVDTAWGRAEASWSCPYCPRSFIALPCQPQPLSDHICAHGSQLDPVSSWSTAIKRENSALSHDGQASWRPGLVFWSY